jgi:hypothetical protein
VISTDHHTVKESIPHRLNVILTVNLRFIQVMRVEHFNPCQIHPTRPAIPVEATVHRQQFSLPLMDPPIRLSIPNHLLLLVDQLAGSPTHTHSAQAVVRVQAWSILTESSFI